MSRFVSRGFRGRRRPEADPARVPPGQYLTDDFPVLSAGPPARTLERWSFELRGADDELSWTWDELAALPAETITIDIHCVTKWSKLDVWTGVSVDTLLEASRRAPSSSSRSATAGTTNVPLEDVTGGQAWVAYACAAEPSNTSTAMTRLLVPHLYFWKSAKWVGSTSARTTSPGSGRSYGYHNYGDPWQEQRYSGD